MLNDPIVIVGAVRTPMGGFAGDFASLAASDLGAVAIKAAVERAGIDRHAFVGLSALPEVGIDDPRGKDAAPWSGASASPTPALLRWGSAACPDRAAHCSGAGAAMPATTSPDGSADADDAKALPPARDGRR